MHGDFPLESERVRRTDRAAVGPRAHIQGYPIGLKSVAHNPGDVGVRWHRARSVANRQHVLPDVNAALMAVNAPRIANHVPPSGYAIGWASTRCGTQFASTGGEVVSDVPLRAAGGPNAAAAVRKNPAAVPSALRRSDRRRVGTAHGPAGGRRPRDSGMAQARWRGAAAMNAPRESDSSTALPPPGIERTATWLVVAVGVLLLFLAMVAGLSTMQSVTTRRLQDPTQLREEPAAGNVEIGVAPPEDAGTR
ncbi:MAG: hypothetical protein D6725_13945 [Planctomycetota bacterium]|nr:MAG: hypothetical protein D6725_13945 [Planctomycetota bacterium]